MKTFLRSDQVIDILSDEFGIQIERADGGIAARDGEMQPLSFPAEDNIEVLTRYGRKAEALMIELTEIVDGVRPDHPITTEGPPSPCEGYTAGDWEVDGDDIVAVNNPAGPIVVASLIDSRSGLDPEKMANREMIARAPKMFRALMAMIGDPKIATWLANHANPALSAACDAVFAREVED